VAYRQRYYSKKKKTRIRSVAVIEKDLAAARACIERGDFYDALENALSETRYYAIKEEIAKIKNNPSNYKKGLFGLYKTRHLTQQAYIEKSRLETESVNIWRSIDDRIMEEHVPKHSVSSLEEELGLAKKRDKEKLAQKRKEQELKARVANAEGKTRLLANSVKNRLSQNHSCPYCGGTLGGTPHADHIYPVVKGGISSDKNMVYVCAQCNIRKRDMTLFAFVRKYKLDRDEIEERLIKMGKDI